MRRVGCYAGIGLVVLATAATAPAADAGLPRKVRTIFETYCYRCHGRDGSIEGGFNYLMDRDRLVARKKVVPGNPAASKLLKRVRSGDMPPEDEKPRPSPDEVALLEQWVRDGAPDFNPATLRRQFLAPADVLRVIRADLDRLDESDRPLARYFTLTHLYDAGLSEDELQTYRLALAKLVNSLSWGRAVVVPRPVDPERTVFRIDLRDYHWGRKEWERILAENPYGVTDDSPAAQAIAAATSCPLPFVRGDWFVAAASRPPLYHDVLQLPITDREVEKQLRLDVAEDIQGRRVARAGFNGSGVSRNNRLIERHETFYGAYWKSYDFANVAGRQNLFAHPLGPGGGASDFQHDGGEIIFNLPNGLQAYMLVDNKGNRIDKGPTAIVSDPRQLDRAVVNGLSCMSCHAHGTIDKTDQVREHVEKNRAAFAADEAALIRALYPERERFQALLQDDAERFRKAVEQTGATLQATEPIVALALRFEGDLDLPLASAEAGLPAEEFTKGLAGSPALARGLGTLQLEGGTVQRQAFLDIFPDLVRELKLGIPVARARAASEIAAEVELDDGGVLKGQLQLESLLVLTAFKEKVTIPVKRVQFVHFDDAGNTLATTEGRIEGKVLTDEFRIKTVRGTLTLGRGRLRTLALGGLRLPPRR
jgi:mono/diheme cytochrome c family protein